MRCAAHSGMDLFRKTAFPISVVRFSPQIWIFELSIQMEHQNQDMREYLPPWYVAAAILIDRLDHDHSKVFYTIIGMPTVQLMSEEFIEDLVKSNRMPDQIREPRLIVDSISDGATIDDIFQTVLTAQLSFMNLPIITMETMKHSRQVRRASEREGRELPDIRTIILRRKEAKAKADTDNNIDWSCRWLVGGHWRNQWFPSTEEHKPVYIVPYVKGPDDKPFRENKAERIFVVAR
jgi:hypothetical protein